MHYPEPVMGGVDTGLGEFHPTRQDFEDELKRQDNVEFRIKASELKTISRHLATIGGNFKTKNEILRILWEVSNRPMPSSSAPESAATRHPE